MIDPGHGLGLAAALAAGLIIGLERGWRLRDAGEGARVAGIRTITLIALAGGVAGLVAAQLDTLVIPVALGVIGLFLLVGYRHMTRVNGDAGITTAVAVLIAFLLGVIATVGEPLLATAGAVITAVILGFKPRLHAMLRQLDGPEVRAILQLALISAVILPLLPQQGYGPWEVLNPYEIWLMVVLISAIGFAGHFAVRLVGPRRGLLVTGLFAGLASSTALTLTLSRAARGQTGLQPVFAAAVVIAGTTMFPRMLLLVAAVSPALLPRLYLPIALLTLTGLVGAGTLVWLARDSRSDAARPPMQRPFELATALQFALLLMAVMVLAEGLRRLAGDAGVYLLALASGLTDVDAITLSLTRMTEGRLDETVAVRGIILAAVANTLVKLGLAAGIARGRMGRLVSLALGGVAASGIAWVAWEGLA